MVHNAGKNFHCDEFRQNAVDVGTKVKCVPVEAHWSIRIVEQAHNGLRRAVQIITQEMPELSKESALQIGLKACNDTSRPNGLTPTLLVFGAYPRMLTDDLLTPSIQARQAVIQKAIAEVIKLRAKVTVNSALNTRNGPNTKALRKLTIGDKVLIYREHVKA
jgi:hypothetical protein